VIYTRNVVTSPRSLRNVVFSATVHTNSEIGKQETQTPGKLPLVRYSSVGCERVATTSVLKRACRPETHSTGRGRIVCPPFFGGEDTDCRRPTNQLHGDLERESSRPNSRPNAIEICEKRVFSARNTLPIASIRCRRVVFCDPVCVVARAQII